MFTKKKKISHVSLVSFNFQCHQHAEFLLLLIIENDTREHWIMQKHKQICYVDQNLCIIQGLIVNYVTLILSIIKTRFLCALIKKKAPIKLDI